MLPHGSIATPGALAGAATWYFLCASSRHRQEMLSLTQNKSVRSYALHLPCSSLGPHPKHIQGRTQTGGCCFVRTGVPRCTQSTWHRPFTRLHWKSTLHAVCPCYPAATVHKGSGFPCWFVTGHPERLSSPVSLGSARVFLIRIMDVTCSRSGTL